MTPSPRRPRGLVSLVPLACLASVLLGSGLASAQPAADADAIIEHGIQLREKGHDDQALVEFRRAYAVFPSPRARAQMGLAEQAVGSWVLAEQHLREALAAETDPWVSARRSILSTAAAAIARHLGTLVVTGGAQPGARVLLDGVDVGPLPLDHPVRVETGSRLLEVRAAGFYPVVRTLDIGAGATARETVNLVPAPTSDVSVPAVSGGAPASEALTEGGSAGPGAFHGAFFPGGPLTGIWSLRDEADKTLCKLPCAYWLDSTRKYTLVRVSLQDGGDIRLPAIPFPEGAYVHEQIKAPTGSRLGGIAILAGGAALVTVGAILFASAPSGLENEGTAFEDEELGVIAMVAGGFAIAGGIAVLVLSEPWRVDARVGAKGSARVQWNERGLELSAGGATAWLTPFGARGVF